MPLFLTYSIVFDILLFFCLFEKALVRSDPHLGHVPADIVGCDSKERPLPDSSSSLPHPHCLPSPHTGGAPRLHVSPQPACSL